MMRRKDREIIDFEKVISIVDRCECCRIGLVDNGEAYIVPMNFGFEIIDEKIILYFHGAKEGRKIDLIPEQKVVTFEMDTNHALGRGETGCSFSFLYQCVMGKGKMEILTNENEKIYGLKKVMSHYTGSELWKLDSKIVDKTCVLKLTVEEWSCKVH